MGIGKTLSDILKDKNSNPNELADKVGVSPSTIYSIIKRDNMKVDITVLAKICKCLNVSMELFYSDYLKECKNKENGNKDINELSLHEKLVIKSYREHPNMQEAVDRLLDIEFTDEESDKKEKLA